MQHLAFGVDTDADLLAMRDRIRSRCINVIGPIDHGMCRSIYFAGPDRLTLEVAVGGTIDARAWVDPTVCAKAGISEAEANAFMHPDPYAGEGGAVAQPAYDPAMPHMAYPRDIYLQMLNTPDAAIAAAASYARPPVAVDG